LCDLVASKALYTLSIKTHIVPAALTQQFDQGDGRRLIINYLALKHCIRLNQDNGRVIFYCNNYFYLSKRLQETGGNKYKGACATSQAAWLVST